MKKFSYRSPWVILILMLSTLVFHGCLSLSQDVTPPPDLRSQVSSTPVPSGTPEPTIEQVEESVRVLEGENHSPGSVAVYVVDHTGEHKDPDLLVQLEGYDHTQKVYSESNPADEDGVAVFYEVPLQAGYYYFATVEYQKAFYRSDMIEVEPETSILHLNVDLFGSTTDTSALSVDRIHVFLDFQDPEWIHVGEIFILSNYGKHTIVADNHGDPVVSFPLPEKAGNLAFEDGALGQRFMKTEKGFSDTLSIPPGSGVYQVMVFYTLPYQGGKLDFIQEMNYPVGAVIVMTPVESVRLKGTYLRDLGIKNIQNGSIHVYAGEEINQGEELRFQISGGIDFSEFTNALPLPGNQSVWLLLGVLGGGLILFGVFIFVRERSHAAYKQQEQALIQQQTTLLDSIIALDDLFDEGEVAESEYRKKRAELKTQLQTLIEDKESKS